MPTEHAHINFYVDQQYFVTNKYINLYALLIKFHIMYDFQTKHMSFFQISFVN